MKFLALFLCAVCASCTACGGNDEDPSKPRTWMIPEMTDSVPYDAFAANPVTRDGKTAQAPAPGSIPRGYQAFAYGPGPQEALRAGAELKNPTPASPEVVARGDQLFHTFCFECHGPAGRGDGLVAGRFPMPPSLVADHAKGLPDGQIFHIITRGQNLMPSHAAQVRPEDRWKIIHYIRSLQAGGAK